MLVAGGERAGKSYVSGLHLATRVPYGNLFWIVADTYELARPEFEYASEFLQRVGAIGSKRDISLPKVGQATLQTKTGQVIQTKSADDVQKLAAVAPDGIVMAEAAQCDYEAYLRCVGRLAEKRGWLLLSGTFEGSLSWYADKFTDWRGSNFEGGVSLSLPSWGNHHVYPEGREDPEILRLEALYSRVEGLFDERCGAVPVPPVGLVFREYREVIHVSEHAKFNPDLPVYLAVDPSSGGNPYTVLACQFHTRVHLDSDTVLDLIDDCFVVDEIYEQWQDEDIIEAAQDRVWFSNVAGGAIDHQAPDSKRRWRKLGGVHLVSKKILQAEGIRRLKSFLHYKKDEHGLVTRQPYLHLHPSIRSLPYEFSRYKFKEPISDDRSWKSEPPVDSHNHSVKALWYLLFNRYGPIKSGRIAKVTHTWQKPKIEYQTNLRR